MTENGKEGMPASAMADILLKLIGKAGYSPVAGYDGELYKQTKKDLNILKRRYEQSMSEQFERETRAAKWICPHCTAENEGTDRCVFCGCLREIHIPDEPVKPAPVQETPVRPQAAPVQPQEKDYSYLQPNVGAGRAKKNNPMLAVLLGLGCVAVMAIALLVANMLNKQESYDYDDVKEDAYQEIQNNPVDDQTQDGQSGKLLDGYVGDTISTAFFDMTANSAYMTDSYEGMTPAEGNEFCVVNMTIHNTIRQSLPMFDTDFILWWGQGDEDGSFPITHEAAEKRAGNMLEEEYFIGINETVTGDLVYELPKTHDAQGMVYFEEYFDNGETGEYYTFTVDLK